jgi:hypothetical protein
VLLTKNHLVLVFFYEAKEAACRRSRARLYAQREIKMRFAMRVRGRDSVEALRSVEGRGHNQSAFYALSFIGIL